MASSHAAFFYGTLMAPQVLHRVCHGSMAADNPLYTTHNLRTFPAILHGHRRSRVKSADYPGVIPDAASSVRGTYVSGLTVADLWRLDIFEGEEYARRAVTVRLLPSSTEEGSSNGDEDVPAETYIWIAGPERLEEREWDFEEFTREKMRFWVGSEGAGEYAEVDEAVAAAGQQHQSDGTGGRGANGHIAAALTAEHQKDELKRSAV